MDSSYTQFLPGVLQQGTFLGEFLRAFEVILTGADPSGHATLPHRGDGLARPTSHPELVGLEEILDHFATYLDPDVTPDEFLPWLAQWVATSLRNDWGPAQRRQFIGKIASLYRRRGTCAGIQGVLDLAGEGGRTRVVDFHDPNGLAVSVKQLFNLFGKPPPFFFGVVVHHRTGDDEAQRFQRTQRIQTIIDREKPAHTYYAIVSDTPAMQIERAPAPGKPGVHVGRTTRLGRRDISDAPNSEPEAPTPLPEPGLVYTNVNALRLSGGHDERNGVELDYDVVNVPGDLTIEMWVIARDFDTPRTLLWANDIRITIDTFGSLGIEAYDFIEESTQGFVSDSWWTHIAVVLDRSSRELSLYVGGSLVYMQSNYMFKHEPLSRPDQEAVLLGRDRVDATRAFSGSICELRVWNKVRGMYQIVDLHDRLLFGSMLPPELIAYIPLITAFPTPQGLLVQDYATGRVYPAVGELVFAEGPALAPMPP